MAARVLILFLALVVVARADDAVLRGRAMGTTWMVRIAGETGANLDDLRRDIGVRLGEIERSMSTWRDDSEIARFNALRATNWFAVSRDFALVMSRGLEIAKATDGAFDPTVLPLLKLWGFTGGRVPRRLPNRWSVEKALRHVGWEKLTVRLDSPALRKSDPLVEVDVSGIAKGFGVDALAVILMQRGAKNWLVEIGGELRGMGKSSKGRPWRVGIQEPVVGSERLHSVVELNEGALATSGDYRNFIDLAGQRHAHLIDPRSGYPLRQRGFSVSVRAADCLTADAWATALCILPVDDGVKRATDRGVTVKVIEMNRGTANTR